MGALTVQQLKLRMMWYGYTIFHTPGKEMYLADSLSRPCDIDGESTKLCAAVESFVAGSVQDILSDVRERELFDAIRADNISQRCLSYIGKGWPTNVGSGELARLHSVRDRLTSWGGLIMYDT